MSICRTSCTEFVVSYVEKRGSFISAISCYHLTPYRPRNEPLALLSSLFRRFLWPVVTISKWNNEKTMRGSRPADVHSRVYRISKCVLASIFEELAAAAATQVAARRDDRGRKKGGTKKKEPSVNRYHSTRSTLKSRR